MMTCSLSTQMHSEPAVMRALSPDGLGRQAKENVTEMPPQPELKKGMNQTYLRLLKLQAAPPLRQLPHSRLAILNQEIRSPSGYRPFASSLPLKLRQYMISKPMSLARQLADLQLRPLFRLVNDVLLLLLMAPQPLLQRHKDYQLCTTLSQLHRYLPPLRPP